MNSVVRRRCVLRLEVATANEGALRIALVIWKICFEQYRFVNCCERISIYCFIVLLFKDGEIVSKVRIDFGSKGILLYTSELSMSDVYIHYIYMFILIVLS